MNGRVGLSVGGAACPTLCRALGILAVLAAQAAPAAATWSVVAVDPATGEVGIAGASCSTGVPLIAGVVPGKGVVAAQAGTSFAGRDLAVQMISDGEPASRVRDALADEALYESAFRTDFEWLQYGVATLGPSPDSGTLTGASVPNARSGQHGHGFAVQGNTLRPGVVDAMATRWRLEAADACGRPLAERLLRTLEAGRDAGGDSRCPIDASSLAAFLILMQPDDDRDAPSLRLDAPRSFSWPRFIWHELVGYTPDPALPEPVAHLRELYDSDVPAVICPD